MCPEVRNGAIEGLGFGSALRRVGATGVDHMVATYWPLSLHEPLKPLNSIDPFLVPD